MAKYQKYAEYKDSGVEWLGDIPSHWIATALKRYAKITDGSHHSPKIESEGFPFVSVTDVGINNINFVDAKKITENDYLRLVKEGCKPAVNDVLLTKDGTIGRACIVTEDMPDFVILSSLGLITPNKEISSHFLYYYLVSGINVDQMNSVIHGSALKRMTINKINDLIFTFPDFYEQEKIANFLDHETAQIDTLIAKQEKLIELLKEKRQAVISHAVTKGLNPHVAMKDSDVEWLGKVPEHWNVLPIKYLTKYVGTGGTPKNQSSFAEVPEINWFTPGDFSGDLKIVDSSKYVTFSSVEDGDSKLYEGKSVLMIGIGATLGKVAISDRDFSCNQQINVLTCNKLINPEFLTFSLMSQLEQIKQLSNSSTIGIINQEKTKQISISVPSVEEQNKIIHFIMGNIEKFNTLINKAESAIQLMQERRTALISSAVTGKIDVRNWQHPNEAKTELSL
ncbi:restriction endonuclease subunit S [Acinetobacter indicus]|nr:restriction endonuclease subunit S [Acinetobacter indicus]